MESLQVTKANHYLASCTLKKPLSRANILNVTPRLHPGSSASEPRHSLPAPGRGLSAKSVRLCFRSSTGAWLAACMVHGLPVAAVLRPTSVRASVTKNEDGVVPQTIQAAARSPAQAQPWRIQSSSQPFQPYSCMAQPGALGFQFMVCQPLQRSLAESLGFGFGPGPGPGILSVLLAPAGSCSKSHRHVGTAKPCVRLTTYGQADWPTRSYHGVEAPLRFQSPRSSTQSAASTGYFHRCRA